MIMIMFGVTMLVLVIVMHFLFKLRLMLRRFNTKIMVSHVGITWNSLLPYLVTFADRLEDLGFRYVDGEVFVPKEEMSEK